MITLIARRSPIDSIPHPPSNPFEPALFFVVNSGSGRNDLEAVRQTIESAMRSAARAHRIFTIEAPGRITSVVQNAVDAAKREGGAVVAVGGDGTINAVASAAIAGDCLFGAVPQGTFNYFGRTHGIPEDIEGALDALLRGKPVAVQVGLVNDRMFLVNASVGLYPILLEDREQFKQRYGRSRIVALWSALVTAFRRHRYLDMALERNGTQTHIRTTTLFVGNNRLQLEQVGMPQAESVKEGQLAGIAVKPVGTMAMLWLAAQGALGKLSDAENVSGFSFRRLTVVPLGLWRGRRGPDENGYAAVARHAQRPRIKVAIDGEIIRLRAPLDFRVSPKPLWLIKNGQDPASPPYREGDTA